MAQKSIVIFFNRVAKSFHLRHDPRVCSAAQPGAPIIGGVFVTFHCDSFFFYKKSCNFSVTALGLSCFPVMLNLFQHLTGMRIAHNVGKLVLKTSGQVRIFAVQTIVFIPINYLIQNQYIK